MRSAPVLGTTSLGPGPRSWGLVHIGVGFVASQFASLLALLMVTRSAPVGAGIGVAVAGEAIGQQFTVLSGQTQASMALVLLPLWVSQLAVVGYLVWGKGAGPRREIGLGLKPIDVVLGLGLGVAAQLGVALLYAVIGRYSDGFDVEEPARRLTGGASGTGVIGLFVLYALIAPFVEELFFRGLLLRSLEAHLTKWLALFASAVLFAAAHFQLLQFPGLVIAGLAFGYGAQRHGRLGAAVVAHSVFNGLTLADLVLNR